MKPPSSWVKYKTFTYVDPDDSNRFISIDSDPDGQTYISWNGRIEGTALIWQLITNLSSVLLSYALDFTDATVNLPVRIDCMIRLWDDLPLRLKLDRAPGQAIFVSLNPMDIQDIHVTINSDPRHSSSGQVQRHTQFEVTEFGVVVVLGVPEHAVPTQTADMSLTIKISGPGLYGRTAEYELINGPSVAMSIALLWAVTGAVVTDSEQARHLAHEMFRDLNAIKPVLPNRKA